MKLFEFIKRFPDEQACEVYIKEQREKSGIVCKKCGCHKNYWDSYNKCWRCSKCGHETTLTADAVMHKLRDGMGKRDGKYTLLGNVEVDQGFFSTEIPNEQKEEKLKAGAGSQAKTKVLVMAESAEV